VSLVIGVKNLKDTWKKLQTKIETDTQNHIIILSSPGEKETEKKKGEK
jgi:cell division protein YceG involved in septum cleavage